MKTANDAGEFAATGGEEKEESSSAGLGAGITEVPSWIMPPNRLFFRSLNRSPRRLAERPAWFFKEGKFAARQSMAMGKIRPVGVATAVASSRVQRARRR